MVALQQLQRQPFKTSGTDPQYKNDEDHANFVEWAIAAEDEDPSLFTWGSVDETDSDKVVNISPIFATMT